MSDEDATGSAEIRDSQGSVERSSGKQRPLQARAAFLQNWDWQSVVGLNRAACTRGGAQHGQNSESFAKVGEEWEKRRSQEFTLAELLEYFRSCHRDAPFLFFNGNTFAGVLDRGAMVQIVESLCESASLTSGDSVKTLRGSTTGVVIRLLPDGHVVWRPSNSQTELIATPEALILQKNRRK